MKLIIDIDKNYYKILKYNVEHGQEYKPIEIIANGIPYEPNGDLISRSEAEKLGATCLARRNENGQLEAIISLDNAPTVAVNCKDCDGYEAGYSAGLKDAERPRGDVFPMKPKEAAEIIHTLRIYHKQCGGCYVKGEEEALKMAEMILLSFAKLDEELTE